jgi:hypothetical protein
MNTRELLNMLQKGKQNFVKDIDVIQSRYVPSILLPSIAFYDN